MRRELRAGFTSIYHLNLRGDARTTGDQRRREGGNIFEDAVRVGVGITLLVRNQGAERESKVFFYDVGDYLTYHEKRDYLESHNCRMTIPWKELTPDGRENWITEGMVTAFEQFLPCSCDEVPNAIFTKHSRGLATCRDAWVYNFEQRELRERVEATIEFYNSEILRWRQAGKPKDVDAFVRYDDSRIAWSRDLKMDLQRERFCEFSTDKVRKCIYRPYVSMQVYLDSGPE